MSHSRRHYEAFWTADIRTVQHGVSTYIVLFVCLLILSSISFYSFLYYFHFLMICVYVILFIYFILNILKFSFNLLSYT